MAEDDLDKGPTHGRANAAWHDVGGRLTNWRGPYVSPEGIPLSPEGVPLVRASDGQPIERIIDSNGNAVFRWVEKLD